MAILTDSQKVAIVRRVASDRSGVSYTRPTSYLALQAIEDWFEANRASLVTAMNTAIAPATMTNPEKAAMVKFWLQQKFERGG